MGFEVVARWLDFGLSLSISGQKMTGFFSQKTH